MHLSQEFAKRRKHLMQQMGANSIAIIAAAPEQIRNGDSHYPYRQNSDFYYLTGFPEPEAVAVFIPGDEQGEFILFNRERDIEKEIWNGSRAGQQGACDIYAADRAFSIELLDVEFPKLLENKQSFYYAIGRNMAFNRRVLNWLNKVQDKVRYGINAPSQLMNIEKIIHEMRLYKSAEEIDLMRKAAKISAEAHCAAMRACKPGIREYELEAEIQAVFIKNGSRAPAYNHIVAAGANSCILHYNDNEGLIKNGDLVLIDAGAEYEYYAADITRTFPANGHFSAEQRAVYEIVLNTQLAVIEQIRPGTNWNDLIETSQRVITEGMVEIGLLKGDVEELIKQKAFRQFYMHSVSHWLGMDVHDVGGYKIADKWRELAPGMVLTVEPGIYIPADSKGVDEKWWNIGVRIEDDILVTEQGNEVLSAGVPKTVAAVEQLMSRVNN